MRQTLTPSRIFSELAYEVSHEACDLEAQQHIISVTPRLGDGSRV